MHAYIRVIDAIAIATWSTSFAMILAAHLAGHTADSWLVIWAFFLACFSIAPTILAAASWVVKRFEVKFNEAEITHAHGLRAMRDNTGV